MIFPVEKEAAWGMLDKQHTESFESIRGDDYSYIGEIKRHNVVVVTWSEGQNYSVALEAALVN